eukprot:gnl/TRDRNA2_/TRDRNA2_177547_c2_seq3.p1 gnl/TRDRNA2_/TRDRNA2_177547_c2~~gnl/TRDRNA2_/TRDRNA2_177547_c2_seq3.p1  ORF type:complete len:472 (+),score=78.45 gnl/TRDRNA2_/TRDRNA2_177547_c2_seq3:2-1417(+)
MPSTTMAPEYVTNLEVAIQNLYWILGFLQSARTEDIALKFIRFDDFYENQEAVLKRMILDQPEATVYGDKDAMLALLDRYDCYYARAFAHWIVGNGAEEGEISEFVDWLGAPLENECTVSFSGFLGNGVVCPAPLTVERPAPAPIPNVACPRAGKSRFHALTTESVGVYGKNFQNAGGLRDLEKVDPFSTGWKKKVKQYMAADDYIIFVVSMADVKGEKKLMRLRNFISETRMQMQNPLDTLSVVLVAEAYNSFVENKWLVVLLSDLVEYSDVCVFARAEEMYKVARYFSHATNANQEECLPMVVSLTTRMYPRPHFYMFETALGRELEDNEILASAVSLGGKSGIPMAKFCEASAKRSRFVVSSADFQPMVERVVAGKAGVGYVGSLIMPTKLFTDLIVGICSGFEVPEGDEEEGGGAGPPQALSWKHPKLCGPNYDGKLSDERLSEAKDRLMGRASYVQEKFFGDDDAD